MNCSKAAAGGNEDELPATTEKKRLSDLLQNRRAHLTGQAKAAVPKRVQADAELTKFLQEDVLEASSDPLMWWRNNQRRYPLMARLAQKYILLHTVSRLRSPAAVSCVCS